jgi:hypothetical protein
MRILNPAHIQANTRNKAKIINKMPQGGSIAYVLTAGKAYHIAVITCVQFCWQEKSFRFDIIQNSKRIVEYLADIV